MDFYLDQHFIICSRFEIMIRHFWSILLSSSFCFYKVWLRRTCVYENKTNNIFVLHKTYNKRSKFFVNDVSSRFYRKKKQLAPLTCKGPALTYPKPSFIRRTEFDLRFLLQVHVDSATLFNARTLKNVQVCWPTALRTCSRQHAADDQMAAVSCVPISA